MRKRARWIRLQRDSRRSKSPRFSQAIQDCARVERSAKRVEEPAFGLQNLLRRAPSQPNQLSGRHAALRGVTRLKRFGHGSKVFPQSTGLACHQTKAVQDFR